MFTTCDCFACFFKGRTKTLDRTHVIRNLSSTPPAISVLCLPCNTGNPDQNYQVHITKLHTNYRHGMHITLLLVAGVIFAPQRSYFNSMSVCFTVLVIAGLGPLTICAYIKLQPQVNLGTEQGFPIS